MLRPLLVFLMAGSNWHAGLALAASLAIATPFAAASDATSADDDHYRFSGSDVALSVVLAPTADGVAWTWPAPVGAWDTALLGVRASATGLAPRVELRAGDGHLDEYLDPGTHGLRWLNLTGLREQLTGRTAVEIRGHGVTIDAGPAPLRIFSNHFDLERPVLILAPHPDDAEIAAFGLYASSNATIVTVTSGNAGDSNYAADFPDPAEHYLFKGYIRAVDSVTVPWQGGVPPQRCFNLGYFDARLKSMHAKPQEAIAEMYGPNQDTAPYRRANVGRLLPSTTRTNTWSHLVDDLLQILRRVEPALIVMPHPFLDTHRDHQYVAVAAVEALERWKKPATFLLYTNHASANRYPFGPAGSVASLPPWSGLELPVQGVYAHPVSADLQRRKLFALESMHDLRLSPAEQVGCGDPNGMRRADYPRVPAVDYLRRGPRPQELFFVFDRHGVRALIRSFLDQERAGE
jgi:LmbE family N-acetylglucosaminyl deacetylase